MGKMEKEMGRLRSRALTIYHHHDFLIIMVTVITLLVLAIWAAKADNADAGNLPDHVEKELVMEAWGEILQISSEEKSLAKIQIFQAVEHFADKRIRWAGGIGDVEKMYLHPLEIQRAARSLLRSAIEMADILPNGNGDGTCSLPEYRDFLKSHAFHYKVVKEIAGIEE